ncbi:MAG TPA: hypothetical protein ENJ95_02035 [Bacteroidetes bacterium]|nr:hypothetical protein [Bacteroidota bacterium]
MKSNIHLFFIALLAVGQLTCNPECISIFNLQVQPPACPAGFEVLITDEGNNASLRGRRVMFDDVEAEKVTYVDGWGLLATVPASLPNGEHSIRIEEPDCDDEVRVPFVVTDAADYFNTPGFIPPAPPEVIIPTFSASIFPPSVTNAWISADDQDYCIWFKFVMNGDEETKVLRSNEFEAELNGSFELGVRELLPALGVACPAASTFYHAHPVSGIVDKDANFIHIFIDRTSGNPNGEDLGIEEFKGFFIEIPDRYKEWQPLPCGTWADERKYMMVLRSEQTGRQLVMYQQE